MADVDRLVGFARALTNSRKYRMRKERREAVGGALGMRRAEIDQLDCIESPDVFVVIKPSGSVRRDHFTEQELRPLLRQAVVAISAAVESYCRREVEVVHRRRVEGASGTHEERPYRVGDVLEIEGKYKRKKWGYREVIEQYLEKEASPIPPRSESSSRLSVRRASSRMSIGVAACRRAEVKSVYGRSTYVGIASLTPATAPAMDALRSRSRKSRRFGQTPARSSRRWRRRSDSAASPPPLGPRAVARRRLDRIRLHEPPRQRIVPRASRDPREEERSARGRACGPLD